MRDRLAELRHRAQDDEDETDSSSPFPEEQDDEDTVVGIITPEAVVFEADSTVTNLLSDIQQIRDDITALDVEVVKFSQQQKSLVATMRRFSVMKKESSITRDIKLQAESIHRRLDALSKQLQKTEELGAASVTARIQRTQHAALSRKFHQVMRLYNESLQSKQERCRHFIIRQLEVSGRDVTEDEVNEMVASGKWEVFNENLLNDARITRSQLSEIEQRHKELLSLENNMRELRDLFMDIFLVVEEQGAFIDHIQTNVERTQDYVAVTNEKFKLAARYKKKNPLRRLCCCCCPPWRCCF
ncbi:unnamed protein product [Knipowitschia caucasica]|uniref:t-SNARE coiled-coil homology domain-containing protein n=1 Tax=Knipowitschia caucasica TaxID=637954 RepID=A0AAV2K5C2_KNICA